VTKLRLSFKRDARVTGLARASSGGQGSDIKVSGKQVGRISPPHWSDKGDDYAYKVSLFVKCEEHPGFRSVRFKARFKTDAEARAWVEERLDAVLETNKFELHKQD
jgi:hypothetical protein